MKVIREIRAQSFRNLQDQAVTFHPNLNLFYGENGAGKTSILEAIYFLAHGRSFRTSQFDSIIQTTANTLLIQANILSGHDSHFIALQKARNTSLQVKINQTKVKRIADVSKLLPIKIIDADSQKLFHFGPQFRRQLMDWGLFHVKQNYFSLWQELQQVLRQRNQLLKNKAPTNDFSYWNHKFSELSNEIHSHRQRYIGELTPYFHNFCRYFRLNHEFHIAYKPGFDPTKNLTEELELHLNKDRAVGYTTLGPQRADLLFKTTSNHDCSEFLSQGQQKLLSYAINVAQGACLLAETAVAPIYLLDDIASELDNNNLQDLAQALGQLKAQTFVTSIHKDGLQPFLSSANHESHQLFHVKHGMLSTHRPENISRN